MPGTSFQELAQYLKEVLPPDTTGETLSHLCAQVACWMWFSSPPTREVAIEKELEQMGAEVVPGGPGSRGTFKVELKDGSSNPTGLG